MFTRYYSEVPPRGPIPAQEEAGRMDEMDLVEASAQVARARWALREARRLEEDGELLRLLRGPLFEPPKR